LAISEGFRFEFELHKKSTTKFLIIKSNKSASFRSNGWRKLDTQQKGWSLNLVSSNIRVGNSIKDLPGLILAPHLGSITMKRKKYRYQNMANNFFERQVKVLYKIKVCKC